MEGVFLVCSERRLRQRPALYTQIFMVADAGFTFLLAFYLITLYFRQAVHSLLHAYRVQFWGVCVFCSLFLHTCVYGRGGGRREKNGGA